MKWKFNNKLDIYLCISCCKIFEGVNSIGKLNVCIKCQFPICYDCSKLKNDFCIKCIREEEMNELIFSMCKNTSGSPKLNNIIANSL